MKAAKRLVEWLLVLGLLTSSLGLQRDTIWAQHSSKQPAVGPRSWCPR
jgi:hypothetical protein